VEFIEGAGVMQTILVRDDSVYSVAGGGQEFQIMVPVTMQVIQEILTASGMQSKAYASATTTNFITTMLNPDSEEASPTPVGSIFGVETSSDAYKGPPRSMSKLSPLFVNRKVPTLGEALEPVDAAYKGQLLTDSKTKSDAARKKEKYKHLTHDEGCCLTVYTAECQDNKQESVYWRCNAALRSNQTEEVRPWSNFILLLMVAWEKLPPDSSMTLWRGYKQSLDQLGVSFQKGKTLVLSSFTSAATKPGPMRTFLGKEGPRTLLQINMIKRAKSLQDFSFFPSEEEVLLPPFSTFTIEDTVDLGHGLTMVQAQQIESVDELLSLDTLHAEGISKAHHVDFGNAPGHAQPACGCFQQ